MIQHYKARVPVAHVDLYRMTEREVDDLGIDELTMEGGLVAIEWAERLPRPLADAVRVYIEDRGADEREILIERPAEV